MGQSEETPGFIEEVLRHRQVEPVDDEVAAEAEVDEQADQGGPELVDAVEPEPEPEPEASLQISAFSEWPISDRTLIDEGLKKSGLIWLHTETTPGGHGYWHVWLDDTIYLLTGGPEQPDGGIRSGEVVQVVVRSKETTARLLTFEAAVSDLVPGDADWAAAATALAAARLNLPDAPGAPDRWAADSHIRLIRLTPSSPDGERPGRYGEESHRAAPRPTTATTAGPKPRILHRRHGSGRPLS